MRKVWQVRQTKRLHCVHGTNVVAHGGPGELSSTSSLPHELAPSAVQFVVCSVQILTCGVLWHWTPIEVAPHFGILWHVEPFPVGGGPVVATEHSGQILKRPDFRICCHILSPSNMRKRFLGLRAWSEPDHQCFCSLRLKLLVTFCNTRP